MIKETKGGNEMRKILNYLIKPIWSLLDVIMLYALIKLIDNAWAPLIWAIWILFMKFLKGLTNTEELKHENR